MDTPADTDPEHLGPSTATRGAWRRELVIAFASLAAGALLVPALIFYAGAALLGRYEGAALGHLYGSVYAGLEQRSIPAWIVVLGPYGLYLTFRALQAVWRPAARTG